MIGMAQPEESKTHSQHHESILKNRKIYKETIYHTQPLQLRAIALPYVELHGL